MSGSRFDPRGRVAILGGGCAGMSLAVRLIERFPNLNISILESRPRFARDRTWCFWKFEAGTMDELIDHQWSAWRVCGSGRDVMARSEEHPYCHVASDRFYDWCSSRLERPGVEVRMGTSVQSVTEAESGVTVESTKEGIERSESFDWVFDGRPARRVTSGLVQHFAGHEVEFERDTLDPSTATLMDFDVDQSAGLHFVYVLPYDARRGLIESTFMTPPGSPVPDYEALIRDYAESRFGSVPYTVSRTERGALPMTTDALGPPSSDRVWAIGTRAGVARASTGYAFDAIQRDSENLCVALGSGAGRPRTPRAPITNTLDRVFISMLADRQDLGPRVFSGLFEGARTPSLLRFLCDRATLRDLLSVAWAMPKWDVTRHVMLRPRLVLG